MPPKPPQLELETQVPPQVPPTIVAQPLGQGALASPPPQLIAEPFQPPNLPDPCSFHRCSRAHLWPVQDGKASCPGCRGVVVAIKLTLCPVCNEPPEATKLRVDHTSPVVGVKARCRGEASAAKTDWLEVDMRGFPPAQEKSL